MNLNTQQTAIVAAEGYLSSAVDLRDLWTGTLITPAALEATTVIGFYVSDDNATFVPLKDQYNALVQLTVTLDAAGGYSLPNEVMRCNYVKVWTCTTAGVNVAQTAARTFKLSLKG